MTMLYGHRSSQPTRFVILQPYGSLFFASAPVFEAALPTVEDTSQHAVVILRLRGRTDLGATFLDVLAPLRPRAARHRQQAGHRLRR